jgi:3'-phosphoadenosine 5'-phosphosulfate sulfotransferase (PAPS reductase)/FAD synthetase
MRRILSYGGGVQTFAMLILIEQGVIEKPDCLIFADTGCEWPHTYDHIENMAKPICQRLKIPFHTVMFEEGLIKGYEKYNAIPLPGFRSCTFNYKVRPIHNFIKNKWPAEKKNGQASFISLIGISTDEAKRAVPRKEQRPKWMINEYPLLDLNISRADCLDIIERSPYTAAKKSGCFVCPYSKMKEWAKLKVEQPAEMNRAIALEQRYRLAKPERIAGLMGVDRRMWLKEFNEIKSIYNFIEGYDEPITECDSTENGGCFL